MNVDDIIARRRPKGPVAPVEEGSDEASDDEEDGLEADEDEELGSDDLDGEAGVDGSDVELSGSDAELDGDEEDGAEDDGDGDEAEDDGEGFDALEAEEAEDDALQSADDAELSADGEDAVEPPDADYFAPTPAAVAKSDAPRSFTSIPGARLSRPILLALSSLNLTVPTPIQAAAVPVVLLGKDVVGSAVTGSGKTVAYWLGVVERLLHRDRRDPRTRVVCLCPTRELAVQVIGVGKALARYTDITFSLVVGGLSLKVQEAELKQRPDVVVATPGRLIDHVRNTPSFTLDALEILIMCVHPRHGLH